MKRSFLCRSLVSLAGLLAAVPAAAQYRPAPSPGGIAARADAPLRVVASPILAPSDGAILSAIQYGRDFAKTSKDLIDLMTDERRPLETRRGGMLGEKRREISAAVWITPILEARWRGFLQQRRYSDTDAQAADVQELRQLAASAPRTLTFLVEIGGVSDPDSEDAKGRHDILADQKALFDRVRGLRFVLSDDKDANYLPLPGPTLIPSILPRQQFYDKIAGDPARLRGQQSASAPVDDDVPGRHRFVKDRAAYRSLAAFYVVSFEASNADGTPRLGPDTKSLTLRVIGPDGDRAARFALDKAPAL